MLSYIVSFYKSKILPGFAINGKKIVIDIGSGDKPFWRGDVFFDKLSAEPNQRITETGVIQELGIFVDGDITAAPFKDKAFDFSFCSHLLEHVEKPDLAIKEIMRISKKGYIEVPNGLYESLMPYQSHLWFIYRNDNKLVFVRKSKRMHEVLAKNGLYEKDLGPHFKNPFIRLYWKDKVDFEIIDNLKDSEKFYPIDEPYSQTSVRYAQGFILSRLYGSNKLKGSEENKNKENTNTSQNYYIMFIKLIRMLFYARKDLEKLNSGIKILKPKRRRP